MNTSIAAVPTPRTTSVDAPPIPPIDETIPTIYNRQGESKITPLGKREDLKLIIAHKLLFRDTANTTPSSEVLIDTLISAGLKVRAANPVGYSRKKLTEHIRPLKTAVTRDFKKIADIAYASLLAHDPDGLMRASSFREPITNAEIFSEGPDKRNNMTPAELMVSIQQRLMFGDNQRLVLGDTGQIVLREKENAFDDETLCNLVASEFLTRILKVTPAATEKYIEQVAHIAERFVMLERWGKSDRLFDERFATPPKLSSLQQSFLAKRKDKFPTVHSDQCTPEMAMVCAPWLHSTLRSLTGVRTQAKFAPIALEVMQIPKMRLIAIEVKDWSSAQIRQDYFDELILNPNVNGHPTHIKPTDFYTRGRGLIRHYSENSQRAYTHPTNRALVQLIEECSSESVALLPLERDKILYGRTREGHKTRCLRYYDSDKNSHYYSLILSTNQKLKNKSVNVILCDIESELAEHFNRGVAISDIARFFEVGNRGIKELRKKFINGERNKSDNVKLRGIDSSVPKIETLSPRNEMLDYADLRDTLTKLPPVRRLLGHTQVGKRAIDSLIFSHKELIQLGIDLEDLEYVDLEDANERSLRRDQIDLLKQQVREISALRAFSKMQIEVPRNDDSSLFIELTEASFEIIHTHLDQMYQELDSGHWMGEMPLKSNDRAKNSKLNTGMSLQMWHWMD